MSDTQVTQVVPIEDNISKLFGANVSLSEKDGASIDLSKSGRAGHAADLFANISNAMRSTQNTLQAINASTAQISQLRMDSSKQMADIAIQAGQAAGAVAADKTRGQFELQQANKAALTATGGSVTDLGSEMAKQAQLITDKTHATEDYLAAAAKKDKMSLLGVITGDTGIGEFLDAQFIHTREDDIKYANDELTQAEVAQQYIERMQKLYTGETQRNTAIHLGVTELTAAQSYLAAEAPLRLEALKAVDAGYLANLQGINYIANNTVSNMQAQIGAVRDQQNILNGARAEARADRQEAQANARQRRADLATLSFEEQVSYIADGLKAQGGNPEAAPAVLKLYGTNPTGKAALQHLLEVAQGARHDLTNPGANTPWVSSPGDLLVNSATTNLNPLNTLPSAAATKVKWAEWSAKALSRGLDGKAPTQAEAKERINTEVLRYWDANMDGNVDDPIMGKASGNYLVTAPVLNTPEIKEITQHLFKPLIPADGGAVNTSVLVAALNANGKYSVPQKAAFLEAYGKLAHNYSVIANGLNRIGAPTDYVPSAYLPAPSFFDGSKTVPVKLQGAELLNYLNNYSVAPQIKPKHTNVYTPHSNPAELISKYPIKEQ